MHGKVTYHQQVSYCGKPRCRKCREGIGHGPYWYAYQTVDGRTTRTYIGKQLPAHARAVYEAQMAREQSSGHTTDELVNTVKQGLAEQGTINRTALYRLSVLGQVGLERRRGQQWQSVNDTAWQQRQVRALLGYLVSRPGRRASHKQVIAALWPGVAEETANSELHTCVQSLGQVLEPSHSARGRRSRQTEQAGQTTHSVAQLLSSEGEELLLAGQSLLWVDADAFENLLQASAVEAALNLYGDVFFPEERHAEWVIERRRELRQKWVDLLLTLADQHVAQGKPGSAIDVLDRLLTSEPTNEAVVQRLIVVLAQLKRRGEALRIYQRFATVLQREYGIAPSAETHMLHEAVRRGDEYTLSASPAEELQEETPTLSRKNDVDASYRRSNSGSRPVQVGRVHQLPLVGREQEVEVLRTLLLDVERGSSRTQLAGLKRLQAIPLDTQRRPHCVLLMGDAGIGKTRLAEEGSREAQRRGWTVLWSRAYVQESGIPYRLWIEVLRRVIRQDALRAGTSTEGDRKGPLRSSSASPAPTIQATPTYLQPLVALLPELQEMFSPVVSSVLSPEQEQLRLWEATWELLTTISKSSPLLIVLDDIQWADASSCELLGYLARHLYGYPIALVGTCRENELSAHPLRPLIAHMQREHSVQTVHIDPLTGEQIGMLVSSIPHLPESIIQHIQTQAAGNPFFAEELARTILTTTALPKTIAAALDSRLSRLSSLCQRLLGNAAVLGGSFELPVICSMEANASLADEDTVLDLLEEALQSGVLMEEGMGTRITYSFLHPLLVSHLYERLAAARRMRLHQRAGAILQRMYVGREEEVAATITHHLVQGGAELTQIVHYAKLAGDRAYVLSAYPEAERHYQLALQSIDELRSSSRLRIPGTNDATASSKAQALGAEDKEERAVEHAALLDLAYLVERLAECTMIQGDFKEARRLYERILEIHHTQRTSTSDTDQQYEAQIQALLWSEVGRTWRYTGDSAQTQQCCTRGEQALREAGVIAGPALARLRYQQSSLYWQEGHYAEARRAAQEALALFEQQQQSTPGTSRSTLNIRHSTRIQRTLEGDPADLGRTHSLLGALANSLGQRAEALAHLNTALTIFEQHDYKREIAHVSCNLGYIYLKDAAYELAQAALRRSLSLAERVGDGPLTSVIFSNLGELAACSGDYAEAERWYKKSLALAERFNDREYMSMWNVGLASVLQEQGKFAEAAECIKQALRIGRAMRNDPCTGAALVALGNMRIAQAIASENLSRVRTRLLMHARDDIQRALNLEGLEAETRAKGEAAFTQITRLLSQ